MHPQTLSPKPCTKQEGKETAGKEREKKREKEGGEEEKRKRREGKERKRRKGKRKGRKEKKKRGKKKRREEREKKRGKRKKRKTKRLRQSAPARLCQRQHDRAFSPKGAALRRKSDRVRPRGAPKKTGFSFFQFHFFLYGQVVARAHNEKKNLRNIFWIFFGNFFSLFFLILGLHFVLFCVGS